MSAMSWGEFEGFWKGGSGGARGVTRGGSGDRGEGRGGGRVTHLGGNAERSASSICRPKGTSVSVAAARARTARTPRGAFVPARAGARRRWGTGARRAPDIDADIITDISHSCVVGPDTNGASLCGVLPSSRHSSFYPKVPEQARASAARAASRRRMKILFLRPAAKKPVGTFTAIPLGYLDRSSAIQIRQFGISDARKRKNCHRIELDFFQKSDHK